MTLVKFYDRSYIPEGKLTYAVINARYEGKWIFVRHHLRDTWEISGGHIEDGESPDDAARREVMEETGAVDLNIECISTYSVEKDGRTGYGRLFLANITRVGTIPDTSEIAEVIFRDFLPDNLTYPDIQPHLFRKTIEFLEEKERN
ncbi:MAG TPA: DNA mismatch repair protein MutT [Bacteroidales bacterium]|nr:DNA mismatch repair protein MutT [Bacteroidales bacterium]